MSNTFVRIVISCVSALVAEAASTPVVPPASVVNNASFAAGTNPLTPGTIAAIFGSNLDDGTNNSFSSFGANGALLATLGGASVTFNGISAPMFSAFPGQLNVQIPEGLGSADSASVVVTVAGQSSAPQLVPLGSFSPGLFSTNQKGTGQGAIQIANTSTYAAAAGSISGASTQPVKPGEFITIYCTGLGAVNNPPAPGTPASNNPLSTTKTMPSVSIGGESATVSFAGLSPGFVGLYQVNAQIPADAAGGNSVPVTLSIGGVKSNTVTIAIVSTGPSGNKIAGGSQHTCAVTSAGAALCWGANQDGQLGNGATSTATAPVPVTGLSSGVAAITAGANFTCALTKAGGVRCWGYNVSGQTGNGTTTESHVPAEVMNAAGSGPLNGVVAISSGQYHTCALTNVGTVLCWGSDGLNNSHLPQPVPGLPTGMAAIAGGSNFACAMTSAGAVWCWGMSGFGQLGAGPNLPNENPVEVLDIAGKSALSGVASIAAGFEDACAVMNGGSLLCWGANQDGEDGNNTNTQNNVPVEVLDQTGKSPLSGVVAASEGMSDACALTSAGGVLCWGSPNNGDLGDGTGNYSAIPVQVSGLTSGVTQIASGYRHNCALLASGEVMCWGFNITGQLGNGNSNDSPSPVTVLGVGGTGVLKLF